MYDYKKTNSIGLFSILCLLPFIFIECTKQYSEVIKVPVIDFEQSRPTINLQLDVIAQKVQYIELESTPESFIGEISDIVFTENYILILDQKQHKIFLFNSTGKFLRKIGQRGKEPGEYGAAFCIDLSIDEKHIYIYSTVDKILKYTLAGEFVSSISTV